MQQEALHESDSPRSNTTSPRRCSSPQPQSVAPRLQPTLRTRIRKKSAIACNTCRARRTKCDSQRPSCSYCQSRNVDCFYPQPAAAPQTSRYEAELATIHQRLDHLTSILEESSSPRPKRAINGALDSTMTREQLTDFGNTPYKLLNTRRMMSTLGLKEEIADELTRHERMPVVAPSYAGASRLFIIQHHEAASALEAFFQHVHIWYPILSPGFSGQYFRIISGPLIPSPESCLVLLVAAVGLLAQEIVGDSELTKSTHSSYFEAAMTWLPIIVSDYELTSIKCLVLISVYYCCLLRPYQAHNYCLMASSKIQNLLKGCASMEQCTPKAHEQAVRVYWAVLLLESELDVNFNVANSGIWALDELVGLPDCSDTCQYDIGVGSPLAALSSSSEVLTASTNPNKVQSYFLAEISMRRMLRRCNTAIARGANGTICYAPAIAIELELQLDEWYNYLPEVIRFHLDFATATFEVVVDECPLRNFLRVQYYCCKVAIYWPAVYQVIEDGVANGQLLDHCQKFFASYVQLMPSIMAAFQGCIVNRWTIFASVFTNTMAAMKAVSTSCLQTIGPPQLYQCFASIRNVDERVISTSASLSLLKNVLMEKLAAG
ncbi:hypothetical protein V494_02495 [Pseudogymnoascus sp. VKM F-4513 (FW-928)]|nr:hypothetical protein V494_02495 [Pseudogymnoascus sp. VKM F-4513 (FW-928)]